MQKEFGRFVAIVLHTDGKDEKYGESSIANRMLQRERFKTVALPYYAILDSTGTKVYWEGGGVFSEDEVLAFLKKAPPQP